MEVGLKDKWKLLSKDAQPRQEETARGEMAAGMETRTAPGFILEVEMAGLEAG